MSSLVLGFQEMENTQLLLVGGKGLNLGNYQKLKEYKYQKDFVLQQWVIKKPSNKTKRIMLCWID